MKKKDVDSIPVKRGTIYFALMTIIIKVKFETRSTFKGLIFVEDHLADPSCRSIAAENVDDRGRNASIRLGFKSCDVERRRSVGTNIYQTIQKGILCFALNTTITFIIIKLII